MSTTAQYVLVAFQLLTLLSAVVVALHPNILYASVALLITFLGVTVLFLFAGADFIAGVQVIVYVGGVTILILFAIMLTQWMYQVKLRDVRAKMFVPVLLCSGVGFLLSKGVRELSQRLIAAPPANITDFSLTPKTTLIGQALLGPYVLPFEIITILLLGALVGGVWLARPK